MFKKYFPYAVIATIILTLLLIFIGGLVRASGAGLGCPDWPKCFGLLIPPTSVADLPDGYNPDEFNVVHTWTEFINRLFGALVGLSTLITAIFSIAYIKDRVIIPVISWIVLIMVLFQAWLGGQVVLSALEQSMITIHLFVAMLIFATLVFLGWQTLKHKFSISITKQHRRRLLWIALPLALFTAVQILLGSQVREALDAVDQSVARSMWLDQVGLIDEVHRTFSWSITLLSIGLVYFTVKNQIDTTITYLSFAVLGFVISQILTGVILTYGGLPASFQVLHLGISTTLLIPMFTLVFIATEKRLS